MSLTRDDVGVWLINLPRDVERRERAEAQLGELGIRFQLFEAIDGRERLEELVSRVDVEAFVRNMGRSPLPGEIGVYASHQKVWEELLSSGHKAALILEDDVVFHDDFNRAFTAALKISDHWDLVRFNCIRAKIPVSQGRVGHYSLNAYIGPFTGNAAYLVTRETAERLLPRLWPQTRAHDHELNRFFEHRFRLMGLEPFASHPNDGGLSTITGKSYALVAKPKWYLRLPYYQSKIGNYFRRTWWLFRNGCLPGSSKDLRM